MSDPPRQVIPYASGDGYVPVAGTPAELVAAMLDREYSLAEIAQHVGSAELVVTGARDWVANRYRAPTSLHERCSRCERECGGMNVQIVRLIASLESGERLQWIYELPPVPAFFPLCDRCARRQRMLVRASNHWHRPAVLIGLAWATLILSTALFSLFWSDDRYSRLMSFATLSSFATVVALFALLALWNLKFVGLSHEVRWRLMRRFRVHSIDVIDLADGREHGVRAVGDDARGR